MNITRGSLASFVSYPNHDKELLILNKNQLAKGNVVYAPVGGVISLNSVEIIGFCARVGLNLADFGEQKTAGYYDLRFTSEFLDPQAVREEFPRWGGEHRTETAHRELAEELVDETGILQADDLSSYALKYLHTKEEIAPSDRADGALTLRVASVFQLSTRQVASARIMVAATRRSPLASPQAYFASREEIEAGETEHGAKIASVSRFLLP